MGGQEPKLGGRRGWRACLRLLDGLLVVVMVLLLTDVVVGLIDFRQ